jgi:hypothetical protein
MFQWRMGERWKIHLSIGLEERCHHISGTQVSKGSALKAQMDELQFDDKSLWEVVDVQIKEEHLKMFF